MQCHSQINFQWNIFSYLKHLNLEKLNEIKNNSLQNVTYWKITVLRITQTKVQLLKNILKVVPNLVYLNLSENFIKHFQSIDYIQNYFLLQSLDLSKNHLIYLKKSTFFRLKNLIFLNLNENFFKKINSFSFANLVFLEKLLISNNFKSIELEKYSFRNLSKLKILNFQSNVYNYMTKFYFYPLISLKKAYFQTNQFCCFLENINSRINCSFKLKEINICDDMNLSNFQMILLLFFSIFMTFYSISHGYFLFKNSKNSLWRNEFYYNFLNIFISLYLIFLFFHFFNRNDKIYTRNTSRILPCLFTNIFYYLMNVFSLCLTFFQNSLGLFKKKVYFFFFSTVWSIFFVIIILVLIEIFSNEVMRLYCVKQTFL